MALKILVVCQYYYPEPVRISDICEELVKKGNEVTVLTDVPNYPMGNIYDGYEKRKNRNEVINGVNVIRCSTIPRKKNLIFRFLNYFSFPISSSLKVKKLDSDFDVVFINQLSPVMMAKAGIKYAKKHDVKSILYCLDLWPESVSVGGVGKKSLLYKFFYYFSKKVYENVDKILITSRSFTEYFLNNFDIEKEKIDYLPQYAESIFDKDICAKKQNDKIDLLFAGNIGIAQSMDTILDAAKILKENKKILFHIVGDGQDLDRCKKKTNDLGLDNVIYYGRKPLEDMPKFYAMADAMLVTLSGDSFISVTLPGKVQSYMAAGKPIIAAANGETKLIIEEAKCGYCGEADNAIELANNILLFTESDKWSEFSNNSYNFYNENFSKKIFINKLIQFINSFRKE